VLCGTSPLSERETREHVYMLLNTDLRECCDSATSIGQNKSLNREMYDALAP
jgi:hypothetical protein